MRGIAAGEEHSIFIKSCHCEPVTDVTGVAIRNPFATHPLAVWEFWVSQQDQHPLRKRQDNCRAG